MAAFGVGGLGAYGTVMAMSGGNNNTRPVNSVGMEYPEVNDLKTGENIPFPDGEVIEVPPAERAIRPPSLKRDFIREWYNRGFEDPPRPWTDYDIHHIRPLRFGGTNDFENLTPVLREVHWEQFNRFWRDFK
jgi:filamentous hemagglutinin